MSTWSMKKTGSIKKWAHPFFSAISHLHTFELKVKPHPMMDVTESTCTNNNENQFSWILKRSHFSVLPSSYLSHLLINRNIPEYHFWCYHNNNIMIYNIILLSGVCKSIGSASTRYHWGSRFLGLSLFRFHSLMTFFQFSQNLFAFLTLRFSHVLFWASYFFYSACK